MTVIYIYIYIRHTITVRAPAPTPSHHCIPSIHTHLVLGIPAPLGGSRKQMLISAKYTSYAAPPTQCSMLSHSMLNAFTLNAQCFHSMLNAFTLNAFTLNAFTRCSSDWGYQTKFERIRWTLEGTHLDTRGGAGGRCHMWQRARFMGLLLLSITRVV